MVSHFVLTSYYTGGVFADPPTPLGLAYYICSVSIKGVRVVRSSPPLLDSTLSTVSFVGFCFSVFLCSLAAQCNGQSTCSSDRFRAKRKLTRMRGAGLYRWTLNLDYGFSLVPRLAPGTRLRTNSLGRRQSLTVKKLMVYASLYCPDQIYEWRIILLLMNPWLWYSAAR